MLEWGLPIGKLLWSFLTSYKNMVVAVFCLFVCFIDFREEGRERGRRGRETEKDSYDRD